MVAEFKQILVVNSSLSLPVGKLSAQVAHAAVASFIEAPAESTNQWLRDGMTKIVLRADSDEQLKQLLNIAKERKLPAVLIRNAGRTVIPEGTITCLGIGPARVEELDALTNELKLLS